MRVGDRAIWYRYTKNSGVVSPKEKHEVVVAEVGRLRVKIRLADGTTKTVASENLQLIRQP